MPKLSVKDFSGGLNTRVKSHAIADNEAVEAENIEFTGYALRSANDLDVTKKSGENADGKGHFYHKKEWITDGSAKGFEEFGDYVIKTYGESNPKVTKVIAGEENTEEVLGVPRKPGSSVNLAVVGEGNVGDKNCFGYPLLKISQWPQENIVNSSETTFASTTVTVANTTFEVANNPKFIAGSEFSVTGSAGNDGRYSIGSINTANTVITLVAGQTFPKTSATAQSVPIRFKTQGAIDSTNETLVQVDTLANSDKEDLIHYGPSLGKFFSYNKTQKKVTGYEAGGANTDNTSVALTNYGSNEQFKENLFVANDSDGATFIDLTQANLPYDNVSLTTNETAGLTVTGRTVNSTTLVDGTYYASITASGTTKYDSNISKTEYWLIHKNQYIIFSTHHETESYVLYKKNAEGLREEASIPWRYISTQGGDSRGGDHADGVPNDKQEIHFAILDLRTETEDWYMTATSEKGKIFKWTGSLEYARSPRTSKKVLTRNEKDPVKRCVFRYCWTIGHNYIRTHVWYHQIDIKSTTGVRFFFEFPWRSMTEKWRSHEPWYNGDSDHQYAWDGGTLWNSLTHNTNKISFEHERLIGSSVTEDSKQARIVKYTPNFVSGGSISTVLGASKIYGRVVISNSASNVGTITHSDISAHTFKKGDQLTIKRSKWNGTTAIPKTFRIKTVATGSMTVEGVTATDDNGMRLDSDGNHGDYILTPEENFSSQYGVTRKEDGDYYTRGFQTSDDTHDSTWGRLKVSSTYKIYGAEISSTPYFVAKTTATELKITQLNDTGSPRTIAVPKHNYIDVQSNRIILSGQSADVVVYNFSGSTIHSRDGAGTSLGLTAVQKPERAWLDQTTNRIIVRLLDETLIIINPDSKSPSQSVLRAPFNHFLRYDSSGKYLFGCTRSGDGTFSKIQKTRPFFLDEVKVGQQIETTDQSSQSIGTVVKVMEQKDIARSRFILVDFRSATTAGNAWHNPSSANWKFFLPGHVATTDERYFNFDSTVQTDIVCFDSGEKNLPDVDSRTSNDRITFYNNYDYTNNTNITSYYYYVAGKDDISFASKHNLTAYKLFNGDVDNQSAYDEAISTHGIGETQFAVGAPNMFDSTGAQIPFRYFASFVDKNAREGAPCEVSGELSTVNNANDSVQITMSEDFFSPGKALEGSRMVEKVRIYRYGGNHARFMWLADRPVGSVIDNGLPYETTVTGASFFYISKTAGDQLHGEIRTVATGDLKKFADYGGSTIEVSGATTANGNNGKMRIINVTTETIGGTSYTRMRVQAHPQGNLLKTISSTLESRIGNNNQGTTADGNGHYLSETVSGSTTIRVTEYGYRDRARNPDLSTLVPQYEASPPLVLDGNGDIIEDSFYQNITNVGGIFFASIGPTVRFSHFNNPHSWPVLAYIELDGDVTGIREYFGEGLVFTENSVYRIRGSNPEAMSMVRLPDNQGLPMSYHKTLTRLAGTVVWVSNDGICLYDSGKINIIGQNKFEIFPFNDGRSLNNPVSGVKDRVLYFFQQPDPNGLETRKGFKIDMNSGTPKVTNTSIEANDAVYVPELDELYVNNNLTPSLSGAVDGGAYMPVVFKSKSFDFGDMNESLVFMNLEMDYKSLDVIKRDTYENGLSGSQAARDYVGNEHGNLTANTESILDNYTLIQSYENPIVSSEYEIGLVSESTSANPASPEYDVYLDVTNLVVGMYVWGNKVQKGSKITSIDTANNKLTLDKAALSSGKDLLYFGDLPRITIYADDSLTPIGYMYPYPGEGDYVSTDMYLNDYFVFRTLAFKIEGVCEVREISLNAEPHSTFNNNTLFHSADMKYTGTVDLVITVDSKDVLIRTYTANAQVNEKRVYIPASTFGTIPFFKNNSHLGRISEMQFNSIDMVQ